MPNAIDSHIFSNFNALCNHAIEIWNFQQQKNGYLKKNVQARFIKKYKFWIGPKKIPSKINKVNAAALMLRHISCHVIFFFNYNLSYNFKIVFTIFSPINATHYLFIYFHYYPIINPAHYLFIYFHYHLIINMYN